MDPEKNRKERNASEFHLNRDARFPVSISSRLGRTGLSQFDRRGASGRSSYFARADTSTLRVGFLRVGVGQRAPPWAKAASRVLGGEPQRASPNETVQDGYRVPNGR